MSHLKQKRSLIETEFLKDQSISSFSISLLSISRHCLANQSGTISSTNKTVSIQFYENLSKGIKWRLDRELFEVLQLTFIKDMHARYSLYEYYFRHLISPTCEVQQIIIYNVSWWVYFRHPVFLYIAVDIFHFLKTVEINRIATGCLKSTLLI